MANRNVSSFMRNVSNLKTSRKTSPSAMSAVMKVLRHFGAIKPQRRTGTVAKLKKILSK